MSNRSGPDIVGNGSGGNIVVDGEGDGSEVNIVGDGDGDGSGVNVIGDSSGVLKTTLTILLDVSSTSDVGVEGGGDGSGVLNSTILTSLTTLILSTTSGLYVVVVSGNMAESSLPT